MRGIVLLLVFIYNSHCWDPAVSSCKMPFGRPQSFVSQFGKSLYLIRARVNKFISYLPVARKIPDVSIRKGMTTWGKPNLIISKDKKNWHNRKRLLLRVNVLNFVAENVISLKINQRVLKLKVVKLILGGDLIKLLRNQKVHSLQATVINLAKLLHLLIFSCLILRWWHFAVWQSF